MNDIENLDQSFSLHDCKGYHNVIITSFENDDLSDGQILQYDDIVTIDSEYFTTHTVSFAGDDLLYQLSGDVFVHHIEIFSISDAVFISGNDQDTGMSDAFFIDLL
ncbi:hypothetical protein CAXC1_180057 [Candidatus Xenohaliotis californiensis]|uniref:Uncharacterized protein n=1 Tax=Candidatus Xenohaliotis californiensis TaxID=84677 RepID=A0ABP0EVC7_9RICK|nr:hypothetical protein CAXC1_180057 [Candidatus Xenohaliotis californiensis]